MEGVVHFALITGLNFSHFVTISLYFLHHLLPCSLLRLIEDVRKLFQKLHEIREVKVPSIRADTDIEVMKTLLIFWFFRKNLMLFEEMHQFLIVDCL